MAPEKEKELIERIKELRRSPILSDLFYAGQASDEIDGLKLYFGVFQDIFAGESSDSEKLKKVEYLLDEFERSYECWTDLANSVLMTVVEAGDSICQVSDTR